MEDRRRRAVGPVHLAGAWLSATSSHESCSARLAGGARELRGDGSRKARRIRPQHRRRLAGGLAWWRAGSGKLLKLRVHCRWHSAARTRRLRADDALAQRLARARAARRDTGGRRSRPRALRSPLRRSRLAPYSARNMAAPVSHIEQPWGRRTSSLFPRASSRRAFPGNPLERVGTAQTRPHAASLARARVLLVTPSSHAHPAASARSTSRIVASCTLLLEAAVLLLTPARTLWHAAGPCSPHRRRVRCLAPFVSLFAQVDLDI